MFKLVVAVAVSVLATIVTSQPAAAAFNTGNEVLQKCDEGADTQDIAYCLGYIAGAVDQIALWTNYGGKNCIPSNATLGQMRDVIVKYLKDHPQDRHRSAPLLSYMALGEAYSCNVNVTPGWRASPSPQK